MSDKKAIWFLACGETIFWAGIYYIFPALIVRWEADFGWSKSELTAALTMALVTSAIVSPVSGRLIDKGYGAYLLTGGGLIGGVLVASLSVVTTLPVFYGIWICLGACMGFCLYEPCFALIIRNKGMQAKPAITLVTLVAGLAGTISFPASHFISDVAGWREAVLIFSFVICFVGVPLIWLGARGLERNNAHVVFQNNNLASNAEGRYRFLFKANFWLLAFGFMLLYMNHNLVINHFLLLLKERQIDAGTAVLAATFIGPMQVLGRMSIIFAERFVSNMMITAMCFIFVILATISLMGAAAYPILLIPFIILQGSGIGIMSIMKPMVSRDVLGGENFGLKSGAQAVPYMIGSAFAALIGSLIWGIGGYDLVLKALLLSTFAGLGFFALALKFR
ncbi:MAG: MFS transporter [Sneathiella sp.]